MSVEVKPYVEVLVWPEHKPVKGIRFSLWSPVEIEKRKYSPGHTALRTCDSAGVNDTLHEFLAWVLSLGSVS